MVTVFCMIHAEATSSDQQNERNKREAQFFDYGDYDYFFGPPLPPPPPPPRRRRPHYHRPRPRPRPRHRHHHPAPPPPPPAPTPPPPPPPPPPREPDGYIAETPSASVTIEGAAPAAVPAIRGGYAASGRFIANNAGNLHIA